MSELGRNLLVISEFISVIFAITNAILAMNSKSCFFGGNFKRIGLFIVGHSPQV